MENTKSTLYYWFLAMRPKTLTASLSPVMLGCALAYYNQSFHWLSALLCFLVAIFAQIASNFANDYFDFKKGADTGDRLGPDRAVAQGWISPKAMLKATFISLGMACLAGLMLVSITDWSLLFVGIVIAICVLAYSAGPFPLAYNGLGDICVLLFYGIIPVCFTYYVQTFNVTLIVFLLSIGVGLLGTNILVVNNYRDYYQDKEAKKRTTIVLFGRKFGKVFYVFNEFVAFIIILPFLLECDMIILALFGLWFVACVFTTKQLFTKEGKDLNKTLGETARNLFLYALITSLFFVSM